MVAEDENPCLFCNVQKKCCNPLEGLRLSSAEFERHFRKHLDCVSVLKYGRTFLVSSRKGSPCPYLGEHGCRIYGERPVDCRLFPYVLVNMRKKRDRILVTFRKDSDCPHREELFAPLEEARELVTSLAQEVFGVEKRVEMKELEGRAERGYASRVLDRVISRISRALRAHR
jgi:Fe-S-cluster containining protein